MILVIIAIIFCCYGVYTLQEAKHIKVQKQQDNEKYQQYITEIKTLEASIDQLQQEKIKLYQDYENTRDELNNQLNDSIGQVNARLEVYETDTKQHIDNNLELYKNNTRHASMKYFNTLEQEYQNAENSFDLQIQKLREEKDAVAADLQKLKDSLTAGIEARLREQEKEQNLYFYALQLDQKTNYEIEIIKNIECQLSDPRPLRMLIWTTYYSKKVNDLCSRVLGTKKTTGIYKITNMKTKMCYIGQAVDIKERWREHIKCGLGIDTPAGNKLYQAMQKDGLQYFTFELLESCASKDLNEKERFFIDLYSSYEFGYNSNRGRT